MFRGSSPAQSFASRTFAVPPFGRAPERTPIHGSIWSFGSGCAHREIFVLPVSSVVKTFRNPAPPKEPMPPCSFFGSSDRLNNSPAPMGDPTHSHPIRPLIFLILYETVRNPFLFRYLFVWRTGRRCRRIAGGWFPYGGNAELVLLRQQDDPAILGNHKHLSR